MANSRKASSMHGEVFYPSGDVTALALGSRIGRVVGKEPR